MFQLRRAAFRLLKSPSTSIVCRPRTITSASRSAFRSPRVTTLVPSFQRRWQSSEDQPKGLKNAVDSETPIEKVEPTPQDEVENAVQMDETTPETSSQSPTVSDAAEVEAGDEAVPAGTPESNTAAQPESPGGTVYVGNLFFDVSEEDLKGEFARFGEIQGAKLIRDARGLSKGFGYLEFSSEAAAHNAIDEMNQTVYEGRRITVQQANRRMNVQTKSRTTNPPSSTLFLGNLSFDMTDRDLNNLFKGIKNVVDVRVAIDRRTGQPRGFAHADFIDVKSAVEAEKVLGGKECYGRRIRVDYSTTHDKRRPRRDDDSL